uniref:Retrotransposon protein, putative, Ty1-copia subclass n=1 Tax=Tanacetum cinerariifolium TaxID=118510 RepID=A0A6L2JE38_TANCI|nr:retrotransposon protein, putative, Ty1-copia subclass [Tanacetum cinerariifolium]
MGLKSLISRGSSFFGTKAIKVVFDEFKSKFVGTQHFGTPTIPNRFFSNSSEEKGASRIVMSYSLRVLKRLVEKRGRCNIGLLLDENRSIKTYPQIGKGTYGVMGIRFVMVLVCLLSFASSEESAMITKDVLEIFYSGEFTLLGYTTNLYKVILLVLCGFMVIMVLFVPDIGRHDRWLTGPSPSKKFVRPRNWPIASGFYAYCFSGHPYLPELFQSLRNKYDYRKILYFIFVPALFQYLLAACLGYGKFGSNVESIYILNMPKDLTVSWIAAHITVAHMMIRYVLGIYGVLKTVEDEFKRFNKPAVDRFWTSVVNCALVLITIPLTILINCYGPVMALIGSTLGIAVALVIPYIFVTNIRISQMQRFQITTSVVNNSVFKGFFEKQKLTGPNFIDWYRQLRVVLSVEYKLNYLKHPIHAAHVPAENLGAYEMLQELKTMFAQQVEQELLQTIKAQKGNKKHKKPQPQLAARGQNQGKRKNKLAYAPKPKIPPSPRWKILLRTISIINAGASGLGIFTIELYTFPNKSWIYDTGCGTHICNTTQGLRGSRKLKPGALNLYVGNEGLSEFCRLYDDGYVNRFVDNSIQVSRNNMVYFSAVLRDGIFEIDLSDSYTNVSSMYALSNKRAKSTLDSTLLWHCRLEHISKKCIEKLQHDGLLNSTDLRAFKKCVPCMSGKMAKKTYTHQVERAKDLLGLIQTNVCGPFKIVSRQGASYFVTFTDDFSHYGYVYLLKHKHEVFEKEVENQLGKTIKSLCSDRGGEYMSQEFLDHLKDHGFIAHRTPPYMPQYNENSLITQEASRSLEDLEIIQEEDTHPSIDTSLNYKKDDLEIDEPKSDIIPICSKWLFKNKTDIDGSVHTYKAHLVVKGYTQTLGIDYEETFSPVADIRSIRILIAITAFYNYEILQMNVKTTFLNGYLFEEVYMEQPEGFINPKYPNQVCKLKRFIYRLKQASRQWNKQFDDEIKKFGFTQNRDEPCVYLKASGSYVTFLILYVDDILIIGNNIPMLQDVKSWKVFCYERFRNTKDMFLVYEGDIKQELRVSCYTNAGYLTDVDDLKSQIEAEYIVAYDASKETVWVRKFIFGLGVLPTIKEPISMYCDNTVAITIANELGITKGARHFHAKVHHIRKVIEYDDVKLEKVHTDDNLADPFTKALAFLKHSEILRILECFELILSSIIIVILAVAAAIAGTVDSINEMKNGGLSTYALNSEDCLWLLTYWAQKVASRLWIELKEMTGDKILCASTDSMYG